MKQDLHPSYHTIKVVMTDGTEVPYTSQPAFWSDLGVTMFAVVLILEGLVIAMARHRTLIAIALLLLVAVCGCAATLPGRPWERQSSRL